MSNIDAILKNFNPLFTEEAAAVATLLQRRQTDMQTVNKKIQQLAPAIQANLAALKKAKKRTEAMRKEAEAKIKRQHQEEAAPTLSKKLGSDTPEPE